jgi:cardiolipin synthase
MLALDIWLQSAMWLVPLLRLVFASVAVTHILLYKGDSRAAVAWIALVLVIPLVGSLAYWVLGINRISAGAATQPERHSLPSESAKKPSNGLDAPPIRLVGGKVTGHAPIAGNRIRLLQDGEQAYPAMLDAIAKAEQEILLMTYLFECDEVGQKFITALLAAKGRGVRVTVLIDDVGRRHSFPTILPKLKQANLETRCFNPLRLFPPNVGVNLRNHRKMLVVDLKVCFSGGMNLGSRHMVTQPSKAQTSDLCFEFQGPIVVAMREVFQRDWRRSGGAELKTPVFEKRSFGGSMCRLVPDGPGVELDNLTLAIVGVLSAAKTRVILMTPYFLPNARIVGALQAAALRGVNVSVILPSRCNWPMVRWALNHSVVQLLEVGVNLFEQPAPFAHSKCLLVDDAYALVGSANIDERSLRLNFELGIEIFDRDFCKQLENYAVGRLAQAEVVTASSIEVRSTLVRLRDAIASLFEPYL